VVELYKSFGANIVVAESNQGGDMVRQTIHGVDESVTVKLVNASKGKVARAEPISTAYERNRVHHCSVFPDLEDQMCMFVPADLKESPDRVDALVWVLTELMGISHKGRAGTWGRSFRYGLRRQS
jgi:phage terminase large subunit-like protein